MKKAFFLTVALFLSLVLCSAASAGTTITALAMDIHPDHLEKTASYARIVGYHAEKNALIVELIAPEVFSYDEMDALQAGDSIYTGGEEILIESITPTDWCDVMVFNDWDLFFFGEREGYYRMSDEDDYFWNVVAVVECPVEDHLLFLDYIDDHSGDMLELPIVRTASEFLERLENSPVSFVDNNVYVVFDGEGKLAAIHRYYVPWQ